jgi:hypothetical protein
MQSRRNAVQPVSGAEQDPMRIFISSTFREPGVHYTFFAQMASHDLFAWSVFVP